MVDPQIYKEAVTTRELFRLISPHFNCLSPHLIQFLCEKSQCLPAAIAVQEFTEVRDQHLQSILCIQETHDGEENDLEIASRSAPLSPGHFKAHALSLDTLQSVHPLAFQRLDYHKVPSSKPVHTFRLSVEVNRSFLSLHDYDVISEVVSSVFLLPNLALVYAGCSLSPMMLTWQIPAHLLQYLQTPCVGSMASGDRLLAEQRVRAVAIGDNLRFRCLTTKVCLTHPLAGMDSYKIQCVYEHTSIWCIQLITSS